MEAEKWKILRNDGLEIKEVIRTEQSQLDCKPSMRCVPHTWKSHTSQTYSQHLI